MRQRHYLLVSDFDQTVSVNDSGHVLSEMLGTPTFAVKGVRAVAAQSRAVGCGALVSPAARSGVSAGPPSGSDRDLFHPSASSPRFVYDSSTGEIASFLRVPAGFGTGVVIQDWDSVHTDWLTIRDGDRRTRLSVG